MFAAYIDSVKNQLFTLSQMPRYSIFRVQVISFEEPYLDASDTHQSLHGQHLSDSECCLAGSVALLGTRPTQLSSRRRDGY